MAMAMPLTSASKPHSLARILSCRSQPSSKHCAPGIARSRANRTNSIGCSPRSWRCAAHSDADQEQATLQQTYTFHTPGSVQEPTGSGEGVAEVVFAHQRAEEAEKWKGVEIVHIGDTVVTSEPIRVSVIIGEFHNVLMDQCLEDARLAAEAMGATINEVVWVPGTYEAPLVCDKLLGKPEVDCVVIVGYIEKGSTLHGEEMGNTCSLLFKQLELKHGKPVGMGIIGPGATAEQAAARVAYAGNAMRAAIRSCHYLATISNC